MPDQPLCVSHLFGQLFVQRSAPQGMIPLGLLVHAQSKCMQAATSVCRCFFTCGLTVDCQGPGKFSRHCNSWGRALAPPLLNVTAEKCFHTSIRISATRKSWLEHLQAVEENWVCNNNNFSWYRVSCFLCFLVGFFLELLLSLAQAINDRSQFLLGPCDSLKMILLLVKLARSDQWSPTFPRFQTVVLRKSPVSIASDRENSLRSPRLYICSIICQKHFQKKFVSRLFQICLIIIFQREELFNTSCSKSYSLSEKA